MNVYNKVCGVFILPVWFFPVKQMLNSSFYPAPPSRFSFGRWGIQMCSVSVCDLCSITALVLISWLLAQWEDAQPPVKSGTFMSSVTASFPPLLCVKDKDPRVEDANLTHNWCFCQYKVWPLESKDSS